MDNRFVKLAEVLTKHSTRIKKGETVIVSLSSEVPSQMGEALIDSVYAAGGRPIVWISKPEITRKFIVGADEEAIKAYAEPHLLAMKKASAFIGISAPKNSFEEAGIPNEKMNIYTKHYVVPVHYETRVKSTKWVITMWPTPSMAQTYEMSTRDFEDFYFKVCADVDYARMSAAADPLVKLMNNTDTVRIVGPGDADFSFSIKGIPAIKCAGENNIPDGEVFTAPVRNSVNGTTYFNAKSIYDGKSFSGIRLVFRDGKIIDADCEVGNKKDLNALLDIDEGARYIGEFALGINPEIKDAKGEILFDEKISKSFHFTPGSAYDEADNGNKSALHWDMVCIQSEEKGGGQIYFDGRLIRDNGIFIPKELHSLNP